MVERTAATVGADAVALADAVEPSSAQVLADWYRARGVSVDVVDGRAKAVAGENAVARSRAVSSRELRVAPALRAIVARAEQLVGQPLTVLGEEAFLVMFAPDSARRFAAVAAELGMCPVGGNQFERC